MLLCASPLLFRCRVGIICAHGYVHQACDDSTHRAPLSVAACAHTQTGRGRRAQAALLLIVTAIMIWLKARKMQRHPRLMDPELAAIMRNGGNGASLGAAAAGQNAVRLAVWGAAGRGRFRTFALPWPARAQV